MRLKSYCVYIFRSIEDSGWVECNDTTTLVGVNESGKTNMLKALWKFKFLDIMMENIKRPFL